MSRTPTNGIDYTSKDYESFRNDMIAQLGIKMPEYTDRNQSDAGIVLIELLAQGLDVLSYYQDVLANEVFLVTEEQRSNALKWCQMLSYVPRASSPSRFTQVFVLSSEQETDTVIPANTKVKTQGTATDPSIYFETVSDLVIPAGCLGDEVDENGKYLYTVEVVQGISISSELLGSSTGSANKSFKLGYTPVILDSVTVVVNEGQGFEKWNRVDNFIDSTATSKDYTVTINDYDEAVITFGDNVFGKIPSIYDNGIFCSYRVGGGTQGNVGAMKINIVESNIAIISQTFNPYTASVLGQDKESLAEIKRNAPAANRTLWGALTYDDFASIVKLNFPEVVKINSCKFPSPETTRDVAIYTILKNDAEVTEEFKSKVRDLFDENKGGRKMIGVGEVIVMGCCRTPVDLKATLAVKPRYDFEEVKGKITEFLTDYFAVGNYDFNQELSLSGLCAEIMNPDNGIEGIRYFKFTSPNKDVMVPIYDEVYVLGSLTIENGGA